MAGRGESGKIEAANRQISQDFEANRLLAESNSDPSPLAHILNIDCKEQEFAHSGRGGACNIYSPGTLTQIGSFNTVERHKMDIPSRASGAHKTGTGHGLLGRAGAGNYACTRDRADESYEPLTGASVSDILRVRVEREIEEGLAGLDKAYLSGYEREGKES